MTQTLSERLHIIEGTDWKEAVIALIEPRAPYRPWRYGFSEAHQGDPVAIVLRTDPCSILTVLGRVGADGPVEFEMDGDRAGLLDLATLTLITGLAYGQDPRQQWELHGDAAMKMELALRECGYRDGASSFQVGHTSLAAAQLLLHSDGKCSGCDRKIDLLGEDARDTVHIHTVDAPQRPVPQPSIRVRDKCQRSDGYAGITIRDSRRLRKHPDDWPAVLCDACHTRMQERGYSSFLDYRFSLHPPCPVCQARRTQRAVFGMLHSGAKIEPWQDPRGCCDNGELWTCTKCVHTW